MEAIGKIVGSKGLKGELKVSFFMELDWDNMDSILIEKNKNSYIPYQIEEIKASGKDDLKKTVKLLDVDDKEEGDKLTKKIIYLEEDAYEEVLPEESFFRLMGYQVYNENNPIGKIKDIVENAQIVFILDYQGQDVLIPYVEEWIENLDEDDMSIYMTLPDGILDINS